MPVERPEAYLKGLLTELTNLPKETEWVEFKENNKKSEVIGEYISALSNSAALLGKTSAFMVWGIEDDSMKVVGTSFEPTQTKRGNEELENWILKLLDPKLHFRFYELLNEGKKIVILEVPAAYKQPTSFNGIEYIRVGSYKKKLKAHPEKERELWRVFDQTPFEQRIALENLTSQDVLNLLNYTSFFDLMGLPIPSDTNVILNRLEDEKMIDSGNEYWSITNLGAILFAKRLSDFSGLGRKIIRVIVYKGKNRIETIREQTGVKGYATGFEGLVEYIKTVIPTNEVIKKHIRSTVSMYPDISIRELVANALIHQDFAVSGAGPMVEIFEDRMEVTNPGTPLVNVDRLLDSAPRSRNEALASFLRRLGICEERGSGIDKVVYQAEINQLPAPLFESDGSSTRIVLFSYRPLNMMDKVERIRTCYLHACLKYVSREYMNNASIRERFGIDKKNMAMASRYIREAVDAEVIKPSDENAGNKAMRYVPFWA